MRDIPNGSRPYIPEQQARIVELHEAGLSHREIAEHICRTRPVVTYHARKLGLAPNYRGRRFIGHQEPRG